jgi:serine phosphatase RsbU (regulator of sigma subunit)
VSADGNCGSIAVDAVEGGELLGTRTTFNGFKLSTRIVPAGDAVRGGDWCETFAVSDTVVALSIGDVCGHGPGVHASMLRTRRSVRDAASRGLDPAQTLAAVNAALALEEPGLYVSALFALLDTTSYAFTYANAGHPPPLMAGSFGQRFIESAEADLLLGVDPAATPSLHTAHLPADTLLVMYTDGVTDRERDGALGQRQLRKATVLARKFRRVAASLILEREMALTGSGHDDAAILTAWTPPLNMFSRSVDGRSQPIVS